MKYFFKNHELNIKYENLTAAEFTTKDNFQSKETSNINNNDKKLTETDINKFESQLNDAKN